MLGYDNAYLRQGPDLNHRKVWRNFIIGGKCVALPEESRVLLDTNVNLSHFTNSVTEVDPFGFSSSITRLYLDLNLRQYLNDIRFEYGFFTNIRYLNYDLGEKFVGLQGDRFSQYTLGAHVSTNIPVGQWLNIQPGSAIILKPGDTGLSFEPRFRFTTIQE